MNRFGGPGGDLDLPNGGTEVFVEVMMFAVSALAQEPWEYRFAALMAAQDQNMVGRGCVGFDLDEVAWGSTAEERAAVRDFVLRVVDLAAREYRWDELGYEPPYAKGYLGRFRTMVEEFAPVRDGSGPACTTVFPGHDDDALAMCVRHRVLALAEWGGCCVFCTR
ncbi:hypothetical protein NGF19_06210 [Streptomyces sp. RY43-2]|uniref:Uncharacterized protein n=1 Tax=Streptomyces macrolidinus TaxID=2952607 RepID=A0ABT0ZB09_9ACTN|nr:hypothetical protein [Streptomyces macrolidinus]MCN9240392.1 hypothetical protein [Streptomyces macrolidinus]